MVTKYDLNPQRHKAHVAGVHKVSAKDCSLQYKSENFMVFTSYTSLGILRFNKKFNCTIQKVSIVMVFTDLFFMFYLTVFNVPSRIKNYKNIYNKQQN